MEPDVKAALVTRYRERSGADAETAQRWISAPGIATCSMSGWGDKAASAVVPANAGTHMWTAPVPQESFDGLIGSLASICPACWCGRFEPLAKMVSATRVPNNHATFFRPMGPTDCLAPRIDRSYHLLSSCSSGSAGRRSCQPADLLSGECRCARHPRAVVTFARRHQLPGDAGNLVGERHRRKFWRLALQ
ncbi:hypothetical protein GALL_418280 [mine drainage metagenome]|uniref:Uncharacterized protein n=1 Tax=mine drainage metagenome TaxID=410659 RepID=A0A1J5QG62_9ZZZZ